MANDSATYLKYATLQMAAEALYEFNSRIPGAVISPGATAAYTSIPRSFLTDGNNRSSRFTTKQADQVIADGWTVLEHKPNTTTGFSGTLFKNTLTGELVLSFRSTEFVDDNVRDSKATNELEVQKFGWAFGQLDDMEQWYASLQSRGLIDRPVAVTGYSLGAHLATAFTLLRQEQGQSSQIAATYTFNGAGVGDLKPGARLTLGDYVALSDSGNAQLFGATTKRFWLDASQHGNDIIDGGAGDDSLNAKCWLSSVRAGTRIEHGLWPANDQRFEDAA